MTTDLQPSFRALSDPTRRQILMRLSRESLTIAQVSDHFELSRTAVRKHLTILEEGHLITVTPRGKERVNRLNPKGLKSAADWFNHFDRFWENALGSLKSTIENDERNTLKKRGNKK